MSKSNKIIIITVLVLLVFNLVFSFLNYLKIEGIIGELRSQKANIESYKTDMDKLKTEIGDKSSDYDVSKIKTKINDFEDRIEYLERYSHWH